MAGALYSWCRHHNINKRNEASLERTGCCHGRCPETRGGSGCLESPRPLQPIIPPTLPLALLIPLSSILILTMPSLKLRNSNRHNFDRFLWFVF